MVYLRPAVLASLSV